MIKLYKCFVTISFIISIFVGGNIEAQSTNANICGIKFNDLNGNGVRDTGEPALANWVIKLTYQTVAGFVTLYDTTSVSGNYCFNIQHPGGQYTVSEINQPGWQQTLPASPGTYTVTLTAGQNIDDYNFGNVISETRGSICGIKFYDENSNGVQDNGEPGLGNWVIKLTYQNAAGLITLLDTTDANGNYCFNNLQPGGTYNVSEINQTGWQQTLPVSPGIYTVTLESGQHIDNYNFGNMRTPALGSICGIKFNDIDSDGVQDPGELGLANWVIKLTYGNAAGFITLMDTTDESGNYCFNNLQSGSTYTVSEVNQTGWQQTMPASPGTYSITLTSDQHINNYNFGNHLASTCTDFESDNGGWTTTNAGLANLKDGENHYLQTTDQSGASAFFNESAPLIGDWTTYAASGCGSLCWDVNYLFAGTGNDGSSQPITITPTISITDGTNSAYFLTNNLITAGDGWHSYCAPLLIINTGDPLPSNSDGHWVMSVGTDANWNSMLGSITRVQFSIDPTSYQSERFGFDNICLNDTGDCNPPVLLGSICGIKFNDENGNGIQDNGELGLANWVIQLSYQNAAGNITLMDTTDAKGNYCFNDLQPGGMYTVSEVNQTGWQQTLPASPGTYTVTLISGQRIDDYNFGNQLLPVDGSTCTDFESDNGGWTTTNAGLINVQDGENHYLQTTDQSGASAFFNESAPLIGDWTTYAASGCGSLCWDVNYLFAGSGNDGSSQPITITPTISISGNGFTAYFLTNNLITAEDGWHSYCAPLTIIGPNDPLPSNSDGHWVMSSGTDANWNSMLSNITRVQFSIDPTSYQSERFGFDNICLNDTGDCNPPVLLGSICGIKFNDENGNGIQDNGELGLANWEIQLLYQNAAGFITLMDTTDASGNYCFTDLQPGGIYTVSEVNQTGWQQTMPAAPGTYTLTLTSDQHIADYDFGNHFTSTPDTCVLLYNTDFESPVVGPSVPGYDANGFIQTPAVNVPFWETTASDNQIEIWDGTAMNIAAYSGNQFAELNCTQVGTLYQTFTATIGKTVIISFAHMGRYSSQDEMEVSIGPDGGTYQSLGTFLDDNTGWRYYTVSHTFTSSGLYRLRFESKSFGGSPAGAGGNFLDAISITCPSSICGHKFNDLDGDGVEDLGEPLLSNWEINLSGPVTLIDTTDADGNYCFTNLPEGMYTLTETPQSGWAQTFPLLQGNHRVILGVDQYIDNINFGNHISTVGSICDSLSATAVQNDSVDCCWTMSLTQPSSTSGITGLQFLPLSPNTFELGSSQLGSGYTSGWLIVANNMNQFTIRRQSGNIPAGQLNNFFNFCLNNLSSPQHVVVNWLDANNQVLCSDTVTTDCDIPCVTFNSDTVICNTDNYSLQYLFTNNATFAISKIEVLQTVPAGVTVTPLITTIPNVNPGSISGVQSFTINGAVPNTIVEIRFRFTSSDSCCSCDDILYVSIPSCLCDEVGATLNQDPLNCIDTLSIFNTFSANYFTQINLTALSPGTTFSNWNTNTSSGWYSLNTFASNSVQLINIANGFIPVGNSAGIIDFALAGYTTTTQKILVEWMRNDSLKCSDTLTTHCTPPGEVMDCSQLIDESITCLANGLFAYKFKVRNNSTHTTTGFQLNPVSPQSVSFNPSNFSSVSIAPSMISPEQTIILAGINTDTPLCFEIALYEHIYQNDQLQYSWCCHSDTLCIITPVCSENIDCIAPPSGMVGWWPGDNNSGDISGFNNNGVFQNTTLPYVAGKVDNAFNFSVNTDVVVVQDNPALNFGNGNFAIDAWIRTSDLTKNNLYIVDKRAGTEAAPIGYSLYISSGNLTFQMGDGQNVINYVATLFPLKDNSWHFVAVTIDRKNVNGGILYVDGLQVLSFDPTPVSASITNTAKFLIGQRNISFALPFNGQIDEVEIFNRALPDSTIFAIFAADSAGKCKPGEPNALGDAEIIPQQYRLLQCYPNPFNPSTVIRYELPVRSFINISVFDILGKEIRVLVNEEKNPGGHEVVFDAKDLPSGIYVYTIKCRDYYKSMKMLLLK